MAEEQNFEQLKSNAERREFVVKAFENGTLDGEAKDFFIEQFNKGELIYGADKAEKIAKLLSVGEKQKDSYDDYLIKPLQEKPQTVATNTGSIYEASNDRRDLGLSIKQEIEKNQKETAELRAKQQAELIALKGSLYGLSEEEKQENVKKLYEQAKTLGFFKFKERRNIIKQLKAIDPDKYWAESLHNPITLTGKLLYDQKNALGAIYGRYIGKQQENTPAKKAKEHADALKKTMELQDIVNGTRLFSRSGRQKIKARIQLLFRKSPEKEAQYLFNNFRIKDFPDLEAKLQKQLDEAKAHENDPIKDNRKKYQAKVKLLSKQLELAKETHKGYEQNYNQVLEVVNNRAVVASPNRELIETLAASVQKWEAERQQSLAKDPQIMAYNKLLEMASGDNDLRKKIESAANALQDKQITADRFFEEAMKQNGFSDEEIAIFKQEYVPDINKPVDAKPDDHKDEETPLDDKTKEENSAEEEAEKTKKAEETKEKEAEENTEANETNDEKSEDKAPEEAEEKGTEEPQEEKTDEQEGSNDSKTPILNDGPAPENAEHGRSTEDIETFFADPGYKKVDTTATSKTFKNNENGRTVTVEKTDDVNYYVTAKTQDGKDDKAQVDELVAVIKDMTKDGSKTIELGEIKSPEFLARAELAAAKAGITISNLEEKKKELVSRDAANENKLNNESEKAAAQDVSKELGIDLYSQEGQKQIASKLLELVDIQKMSTEEYAAYQKSDKYTKMPESERKIFDNVYKLTTDEEYKKAPEAVRYRALSKLIEKYQEVNNEYNRTDKKRNKNTRTNTQRSEIFVRAMVNNMKEANK